MDDFAQRFELARKLGRARQFHAALDIARTLPEDALDPVQLNGFIASQHAGLGEVAAAAHHLARAFWAIDGKPPFALFNDLVRLYRLSGQDHLIPVAMERVMGKAAGLPSRRQYFVLALPRSAGTSFCSSLADALKLSHVASGFDSPRVPHHAAALLGPEISRRLGTRPIIHQTHAMPWPDNFTIVERFGAARFIVHIRDPRRAALSYFTMAEASNLHRLRMVLAVPGYNGLSAPERCERVLDLAFPTFVDWISGWVDYADRSNGRALVTDYDTFTSTGARLVQEACTHLAGHGGTASRIYQTHRRKHAGQGDPQLSPERRQFMFEQIPERLRSRFGWTP